MRRRLLLLLLPVFLLLAQQGAAWHELSHWRALAGDAAAHVADATGKRGEPQAGSHVCDDCLAFAGLADLARPADLALALLSFEQRLAPAPVARAVAAEPPTARSRGPPALS